MVGLGAALPRAGGSYVFLREAYGPNRWGRLMSFLFVWQTLIQAPLVIASGAIGFSQYASYLHPLSAYQQKAISGIVVLLLVALFVPPDHYHRKNLRAAMDRCDRHDDLAYCGRHSAFQSRYGIFIPTRRVSSIASVFRGTGRGHGQHYLYLLGLLQHLSSGQRVARAAEKYSARDFYFYFRNCRDLSGHADQHSRCSSLAKSSGLEISGEHFRGNHLRPRLPPRSPPCS